ncbi:penicillin-binding transpeptidase domain-containing protein [Paenibacillus radicis (ex Xue et al. 2023)]|uniref:Penicillin-binding transpeptidase domain-containing protein n=1 Tax=Paenibacillus radicis (ex Xue et al. 2023) TaxID=2972489 RepID=A0ABT1YBX7_9BACL|nr:penicillin-binding transpeptidase domain-containing protein [Paenibacillus radicis (ex Xue et al. 2023)]MCR8630693.1 penicillin-binding transpeptidase domain-containing protein [Paenibacillus radicis (ex Xue et al. 2023)]
MLITAMAIVAGCKEKGPTSEEVLRQYITVWEKGDYDAMYSMLSDKAKTVITQEAFTKRHQSIYEGVSARGLTIKLVPQTQDTASKNKQETGKEPVKHPITVQMETFAGPVAFGEPAIMIMESNVWRLDWSPSLLFPSLKEGDKVRVQQIKAIRGEIADRNGKGLAINEERAEVGIIPNRLPNPPSQALQQLADLLKINMEDIDKKRNATWVKPEYFVPVALLSRSDKRLAAATAIPGVSFQTKKVRFYPFQEAAAHLIGYIGKLTQEEWAIYKDKGYQIDDDIGKAGLEQVLEERLKGKDGGRIYIADANGKEKVNVVKRDARNGEDITLTIDAELQMEIYQQLNSSAGAGAALHPITGEVLALVSSPSYDPNAFVAGVSAGQWKEWSENPAKPLLNRFARTFSPGSAFKPLTAAMGLQTKTMDPEQLREIQGLHWKKDASWGNYEVTRVSQVATQVNLQKALLYSDNIYFAQAALDMGTESFMQEAGKFGLGEKLPIPYPLDTSTLVNKTMKNDIQLADSGYGQGEIQMNPLHVALAYTPFINQGDLIAPKLLMDTPGLSTKADVWKKSVMFPPVAALLQQDLIQVIEHPQGTGRGAQIKGLTLAGKTGTAELKQNKGMDGKEVGWFVAYNVKKPQLLLALMMEDVQNRGGSHALSTKISSIFKLFVKE